MTNAFQQIFLGTYVLTLILRPLVYSCDNTRPTIDITEDYNNIIYPVLQKVENIIANDLQNETCKTKQRNKHLCEANNERSSIHKMVSAIQLKLNNEKDETGTHSECAHLPGQRWHKKGEKGREKKRERRLCRVRRAVDMTRSCYAKLKEQNG